MLRRWARAQARARGEHHSCVRASRCDVSPIRPLLRFCPPFYAHSADILTEIVDAPAMPQAARPPSSAPLARPCRSGSRPKARSPRPSSRPGGTRRPLPCASAPPREGNLPASAGKGECMRPPQCWRRVAQKRCCSWGEGEQRWPCWSDYPSSPGRRLLQWQRRARGLGGWRCGACNRWRFPILSVPRGTICLCLNHAFLHYYRFFTTRVPTATHAPARFNQPPSTIVCRCTFASGAITICRPQRRRYGVQRRSRTGASRVPGVARVWARFFHSPRRASHASTKRRPHSNTEAHTPRSQLDTQRGTM